MSTRPQFKPKSVITNGNMASATLTSAVTIIQTLSMMSYGLSWAGSSPVGAVSVQVSNDYSQNGDGSVNNAGTWNTISFNISGTPTSSIAISGNTGNGFLDLDASGAYAVRLVYTKTSGTGSLQCVFSGKVS